MDLVELLKKENEQLKLGLIDIQSNLAESVNFSQTTFSEFQVIDQQFKEIVENSALITEQIDILDESIVESVDSSNSMISNIKSVVKLL